VSRPKVREKHDGQFEDRANVRLWLRLLTCSTIIEKRVRRGFAERFGTTLPRFDVLASLARSPAGMRMSELSRLLLVSNGNVTGLVKTLAGEGLVSVAPAGNDRRVTIASLTPAGRIYFDELATAHRAWIDEVLGGFGAEDRDQLYALLGTLKDQLATEAA
jgi:DNA-binding MarR family transcriptional regulator